MQRVLQEPFPASRNRRPASDPSERAHCPIDRRRLGVFSTRPCLCPASFTRAIPRAFAGRRLSPMTSNTWPATISPGPYSKERNCSWRWRTNLELETSATRSSISWGRRLESDDRRGSALSGGRRAGCGGDEVLLTTTSSLFLGRIDVDIDPSRRRCFQAASEARGGFGAPGGHSMARPGSAILALTNH